MSAKVRALSNVDAAAFAESDVEVTTIRVPCPGIAHQRGEVCMICDAEMNGTIEVLLTSLDRDALSRAAHGVPVDASRALRLCRLGLLETIELTYVLTQFGYEILGEITPDTTH